MTLVLVRLMYRIKIQTYLQQHIVLFFSGFEVNQPPYAFSVNLTQLKTFSYKKIHFLNCLFEILYKANSFRQILPIIPLACQNCLKISCQWPFTCTVHMYCNEKKSYTRPSGEIILRMTERERVHCGRICCIERTRGVLVEYGGGGGGQPQTQGTCLRAVWVVTGWDIATVVTGKLQIQGTQRTRVSRAV